MKRKKKKITKSKKKFFIILACYIAVFVITCVTTAATLSWFQGSTWQDKTLYMGGPVYLYFSDSSGVKETSKANSLTIDTPADWDRLYPGMNMRIGARCVVQGAKFENKVNNETQIVYTTGAVLRARIAIKVKDPLGNYNSELCRDVYDNVWAQMRESAIQNEDDKNEGVWVMDDDFNYVTQTPVDQDNADTSNEEDHFFYYVKKNQSFENSGKYGLLEVGGTEENVSVGFLDKAVLTLSGVELSNLHAECEITFTIIFHGLQAFLPYESTDIGSPYQGDTTGRLPTVSRNDVGMPKPLTIENSRKYFRKSFESIYSGIDGAIY